MKKSIIHITINLLFLLYSCSLLLGQSKTLIYSYNNQGNIISRELVDYTTKAKEEPAYANFYNNVTDNVVVSPNPASTNVAVLIKDYQEGMEGSYTLIYSGSGVIAKEGKIYGKQFDLDLSSLNPDLYFLIIRYGNKIENRVIIKN